MPGIAVAVGAHPLQAEAVEEAREDVHRVLASRVLGIRLDAIEVGLRADTLDLELGHEDDQLAGGAADDRHGAFRGEEAEAREVLDVFLVEEHVAVELLLDDLLEQKLAAHVQLVGVNAGTACLRRYLADVSGASLPRSPCSLLFVRPPQRRVRRSSTAIRTAHGAPARGSRTWSIAGGCTRATARRTSPGRCRRTTSAPIGSFAAQWMPGTGRTSHCSPG